MSRVRIITDSTCDLPAQLIRDNGIIVVPLYVHISDETYLDGIDISPEEFYRRLSNWSSDEALPTTSHATVETFEELYKKLLKEGDTVISIHKPATCWPADKVGQAYSTTKKTTSISGLFSFSVP